MVSIYVFITGTIILANVWLKEVKSSMFFCLLKVIESNGMNGDFDTVMYSCHGPHLL